MYALLLLLDFIRFCKKKIINIINPNTEETQLPAPREFNDFKNFRLKDIYEIKNSEDAIPKGYKRISNNLPWSPYEHPEEFNAAIIKRAEEELKNGWTGDIDELLYSLLYEINDSHSSEIIVTVRKELFKPELLHVLDSEPRHYFELLKYQLLLAQDPFPLLVDEYNRTSFKEHGYTFSD